MEAHFRYTIAETVDSADARYPRLNDGLAPLSLIGGRLTRPRQLQSFTLNTSIGSAIRSGAISCSNGTTAVPMAKNSITCGFHT